MNMDNLSINTIRSLGLAMVDEANSGHPGIVLGAAPIIYTIYTRHLNANVNDLRWINRDRFVMSVGHGSAMYYATLHLAGYDVSLEDLKNFRKLNSKTPGHPEFQHTPGIDATSGPLGQGIATATGIAVAEEFLRSKYSVVNHYTYVLCGDGDLQEGVAQEAISFAGHQELGRLIVLYDSNDIQLDSKVSDVNSENVQKKYEAMNWHYILVEDGNNIDEIDTAIVEAKQVKNKPSIIEVKTQIGFGSSKVGTSSVHGAPLGVDESKKTMSALGYDYDRFDIDSSVYAQFENTFAVRGLKKYSKWNDLLEVYREEEPDLYAEILKLLSHNIEIDFEELYNKLDDKKAGATRNLSGEILREISSVHPYLLAGSADLSGSTKIKGEDGVFSPSNRNGRNILYGVREHAMASISNGLVLHSGIDAIASGFFVFSDYSKPAIRMSSLMNIPTIYAFTHDSVAVGEDGPTHEPVEQLTMLRSTPNIDVFRPADLCEVVASYKMALNKQNPSAIILSRQDLPSLHGITNLKCAQKGAYNVVKHELPDGIIMACGSELSLAIEVSKKLEESNVFYNVVSMLSMEVFESQSDEYIQSVLPSHFRKRVAIEMGSAMSWYKYVGLDGLVFSIETFGKSGPGEEVIDAFGFDKETIAFEIMKLSLEN